MSMSAEPVNAPCSAMWIRRESIVASTWPSTTSVSQSVISTPLSLMFGPTVSLAGLAAAVGVDAATSAAGTSAAAWGSVLDVTPALWELPVVVCVAAADDARWGAEGDAVDAAPLVWFCRVPAGSLSRLPKKFDCNAMGSP